jgi:hypothetical protein
MDWFLKELWNGIKDLGQLFYKPNVVDPRTLPMNQPIEPQILSPQVPSTPPIMPVEAPPANAPTLTTFCTAIRDNEGSPGERNYRNNNPGNCRYSPVGYLPIYGIVTRDPDNFAIFETYALGWLYLENLVKEKFEKNPNETIYQFFENYAPVSDGNDPVKYAAFVATRCDVDSSFIVKNILI